MLDDHAVIVKPAAARRQFEEDARRTMEDDERRRAEEERRQREREKGGGETGEGRGGVKEEPEEYGRGPRPEVTPVLSRFHGAVELNAMRLGRDAGEIAQEVVQHLSALASAKVRVRLEIEVEAADGVPDDVVRTVTENCRTLKFTSFDFEAGDGVPGNTYTPSREMPPRLPLHVPMAGQDPVTGMLWDGFTILTPDDPRYDENYRTALYQHREYGRPMPYATAGDDDE